ncbi:MAG: Gfo/Idh/MocA family oxidoreductase [Chloroflexota bacterium]
MTIRVGMVSFWHVHAGDYARQAAANPATDVVVAWDEDPARGQREADTRGLRFYGALDDLLGQSDVDAVIVDAPSTMHREVMIAAARAGKHIFTEKVLAPTLADCHAILAAVEHAGVILGVSLPRLYDGYTRAIHETIQSGELGDLTLARVRLSHNGALPTPASSDGWLPAHFYAPAETAGGALVDLGCHPMYLVRLFLGLPESVSARFGYVTGRAVEDNAVATLGYTTGALGVVEAGLVTPASPFAVEVHGTRGSLLYGTPEDRLLVRSGASARTGAWETRDVPPGQPTPFDQWVTHVLEGTQWPENVAAALDLTRLMEAAYLSARQECAVRLDSLEKTTA